MLQDTFRCEECGTVEGPQKTSRLCVACYTRGYRKKKKGQEEETPPAIQEVPDAREQGRNDIVQALIAPLKRLGIMIRYENGVLELISYCKVLFSIILDE